MRILLDENIPAKVKLDFGKDYQVKTVQDMQWHGKKNGELLSLMTASHFDFFITVDRNLRYQQNLGKYDVTIFLLYPFNNKHQTIQPFIEKVKQIILVKLFRTFNEVKL